MIFKPWGGGNIIGRVYVTQKDRNGSCTCPPEGSLCVCVKHSGDCFYNYIPLVVERKRVSPVKGVRHTMRLKLSAEFGSYTLSEASMRQLSDREFHLLMAGETVNFQLRKASR